jgi:hypothetical protein
VAAGQTGGCWAWGFKLSVAVKRKKKKEKKKRTSCSIGCICLHLAAGWVPVDLAEVVVAAVETVAGMGGSRSDWRASGMGVQAVSCSQIKDEEKKKRKKERKKQKSRLTRCLLTGVIRSPADRDGTRPGPWHVRLALLEAEPP